MHELLQATITSTTCGMACWRAKEDTCRCVCNGKNHGIYLDTGENPERTRKVNGQFYRLVSVHEGYAAACQAERNFKAPHYASLRETPHVGYFHLPFYRVFHAAAAPHQLKWPEFAGMDPRRAYGLWAPVEMEE